MADFDFGDGLRKVFLAGVGALATTVEKSQEIVDDLVKKGELTVEQGKALNAELKHKVQEAKDAGDTATAEKLQQTRTMVETGNFVRASLFTSVMAFGVSALVMGAGLLFSFLGWGLYRLSATHAQEAESQEA